MRKLKLWLAIGTLILAILACNFPSSTPTTGGGQTPQETQPSAGISPQDQAATIVALTLTAQASLIPPTATETATLAATGTPTLTSTPEKPMVYLSEATNCRTGNAKAYDLVFTLNKDRTAEVIGKDAYGQYWYIRNPDNPAQTCWLWGYYATPSGDTAALPVFTPPPSPTPVPSFTVSYSGLDTCVGWWVEFNLKNTGPVPFESVNYSIKDEDTGTTISDSVNSFTDTGGCLLSSTVSALDPGDSVNLSTNAFVYDPTGNHLTATIKLCTQNNLGGYCASQSISFRP